MNVGTVLCGGELTKPSTENTVMLSAREVWGKWWQLELCHLAEVTKSELQRRLCAY